MFTNTVARVEPNATVVTSLNALIWDNAGFPETRMLAALCIGVRVAENNFVTLMMQKKMIQIPPALIVIAPIAIGVLAGFLGLLLALPLLAIVIALVKTFYLQDALGEPKAPSQWFAGPATAAQCRE